MSDSDDETQYQWKPSANNKPKEHAKKDHIRDPEEDPNSSPEKKDIIQKQEPDARNQKENQPNSEDAERQKVID